MRKRKAKLALLHSFLLFSLIFVSSCTREGLAPGDKRPGFSVPDITGVARNVESFEGKVVLVNFWATWCSPCVDEMPVLAELREQYAKDGFEVVAVAVNDTKEAVSNFAVEHKLSYPILLDPEGVVARSYKVTKYPETFLLSRSGEILMVQDPESGLPATRLKGPRDWNSPKAKLLISELLHKNG